jgi:hypothetical protein
MLDHDSIGCGEGRLDASAEASALCYVPFLFWDLEPVDLL